MGKVLVKGAIELSKCNACGGNSHSGCLKYEGVPFSQCPQQGGRNYR